MKHLFHILITVLLINHSTAQVALDILPSSPLAGTMAHTWAEPAAVSWSTPDMTLVANRVIGELVLALDPSEADSLVCDFLDGSSPVTGKIAVLYRGTCDYSEKARNCQLAGAIGVIIINNEVGPPVGMGAGAVGQQVNIPVFQIGLEDGALIRTELLAGITVTALLGNKTGYYPDDIGLNKFGLLLPPSFARPSQLTANTGEYILEMAAWVHNFGQLPRTGAVLNARVEQDGNVLYDESSPAFAINPGDSVLVTLPDHTQNSYQGTYTLTYSVQFPGTDAHVADNSIALPMVFDSYYALVPLDAVTNEPVSTIGMQPSPTGAEYESCIHFKDAHASRVAATGLHFYVSINDPSVITGELIYVRAYEWMDQFTGLSDPAFNISNLLEVGLGEHFLTGAGNQQTTFLPFQEPVALMDDQRYLFCVSTFNPDVFLGFNEDVHYATHEQFYDQPTCPNRVDNTWYIGFVGGPVSSIGVHMIDAAQIGIAERTHDKVAPYPNPGSGMFWIGLDGSGPSTITITDAAGRIIATHRATATVLELDLEGQAPGVYLVRVEGPNGIGTGRLVLQ